jgi:hypothetical protein
MSDQAKDLSLLARIIPSERIPPSLSTTLSTFPTELVHHIVTCVIEPSNPNYVRAAPSSERSPRPPSIDPSISLRLLHSCRSSQTSVFRLDHPLVLI